jgi:hypothetical protein
MMTLVSSTRVSISLYQGGEIVKRVLCHLLDAAIHISTKLFGEPMWLPTAKMAETWRRARLFREEGERLCRSHRRSSRVGRATNVEAQHVRYIVLMKRIGVWWKGLLTLSITKDE